MRETGPTARILSEPGDAYTKSLLAAAAPQTQPPPERTAAAPLLEVHSLTAGYGPRDRRGPGAGPRLLRRRPANPPPPAPRLILRSGPRPSNPRAAAPRPSPRTPPAPHPATSLAAP